MKVYEQSRTVDYADYKVSLFYISPFDLFVEGEPVISKLEKQKSRSPLEYGSESPSAKAITNGNPNP